MKNTENNIKDDLIKTLMTRRDVRIFRNNVGMAYQGNAKVDKNNKRKIIINFFRRIKYGLIKGSGDFIGWKEIKIDKGMVGKKVAVFLSIETKKLNGKRSKQQINWCNRVNTAGGIAFFVDDIEKISI